MNQDNKNQIDKLFHYTSFESVLKIIESCLFKATKPEDFNDPFECKPAIKKREEYTEEEFLSLFNEHDKLNTDLIEKGREFYRHSNSSKSFLDFFNTETNFEGMDYQKTVGKHFRIISCTTEANVISMWAHYSGNHTGVVIEFDLNHMPFPSLIEASTIIPVSYNKNRANYDHLKSELERHKKKMNGERSIGEFYKISTTKDECWKPEKEVKIILPMCMMSDSEKYFYCENDNLFLKLEPKSFKTIYCGMKMPDINRTIIERLSKSRFGDHTVPIHKVSPSNNTYDFFPFSKN